MVSQCDQLLRLVMIRLGEVFEPGETDSYKLYEVAAKKLGLWADIQPVQTPAGPMVMPGVPPMPKVPLQKCEKCGQESVAFVKICNGCKDSIGPDGKTGHFKTMSRCGSCGDVKKSTMFLTQVYDLFGIDYSTGRVPVKTDEGVK